MTVKIPDFDTLQKSGLELVRKLASDTWTDHNNADPGVTLLEQLCYALTDLGYRVDFDIVDLLAGGSDDAYRLLFSPRQVLSTQPVGFTDYRQVLIDSDEVNNAHLSEVAALSPAIYYAPFSEELLLQQYRSKLLSDDVYHLVQLKGLIDVQIQKEDMAQTADVEQQVQQKLMNQCGLATDIATINVLPEEKIKIQVELELGVTKDIEALVANVLQVLYQYINPSFAFENMESFLKDQLVEKAFDGPSLARGFLRKSLLEKFQKRTEFRRSDLVQALMNLAPEIKAIRALDIAKEGEAFSKANQDWVVALEENKAVVFDLEASNVLFFIDDLPVAYHDQTAKTKYKAIKNLENSGVLTDKDLDYLLTKGSDREVTHYTSIRQHIPEVYGITPYGLPQNASDERKAQTRQLSAYLLFFEQILADFFAQLGGVPQLMSVDPKTIIKPIFPRFWTKARCLLWKVFTKLLWQAG